MFFCLTDYESGRGGSKFHLTRIATGSLTPCLLDMLAVPPSLSSALPYVDRYGAVGCNGKGSLGCSPSVPNTAYIGRVGRAGKWSNGLKAPISSSFNSMDPSLDEAMEHSEFSTPAAARNGLES